MANKNEMNMEAEDLPSKKELSEENKAIDEKVSEGNDEEKCTMQNSTETEDCNMEEECDIGSSMQSTKTECDNVLGTTVFEATNESNWESNANMKADNNHPYKEVLENIVINEESFKKLPELKPEPINKRNHLIVATKTLFLKIIEKLSLCDIIGVSVKYTQQYKVSLSLVQISSRNVNYLIDALKLNDSIHLLSSVFANPKIVKVLHGARRVVKFLQVHYNLYLINVFDTLSALQKLEGSKEFSKVGFSLQQYLRKKIGVKKPKLPMENVWHLRPLEEIQIKYALTEVHYLPSIYVTLYNAMLDKGLLKYFLIDSLCMTKKIHSMEESVESMFPNLAYMPPRQVYAMYALEDWRHSIGREKNITIYKILPNIHLQILVKKLPTTPSEIKKICRKMTSDDHINAIHKILVEAQNVIGPTNSKFGDVEGVGNDSDEFGEGLESETEVKGGEIEEIINEALKKGGVEGSLKEKITAAVNNVLDIKKKPERVNKRKLPESSIEKNKNNKNRPYHNKNRRFSSRDQGRKTNNSRKPSPARNQERKRFRKGFSIRHQTYVPKSTAGRMVKVWESQPNYISPWQNSDGANANIRTNFGSNNGANYQSMSFSSQGFTGPGASSLGSLNPASFGDLNSQVFNIIKYPQYDPSNFSRRFM